MLAPPVSALPPHQRGLPPAAGCEAKDLQENATTAWNSLRHEDHRGPLCGPVAAINDK